MWIAPELVAASLPITSRCSLSSRVGSVELRFEILDPAGIDTRTPHLMARNHGGVDFEWNSATSELSYRTQAASAVFSDLALPSDDAAASAASCESR